MFKGIHFFAFRNRNVTTRPEPQIATLGQEPQSEQSDICSVVDITEVATNKAPTEKSVAPAGLRAKVVAVTLNLMGSLALGLMAKKLDESTTSRYQDAAQKLSGDKEFEELAARSSFDGLLSLFRRDDLPGEKAGERLDFILWYTSCKRNQSSGSWELLKNEFTHFNTDTPFMTKANDRGFAEDLRDGYKWYNPNGIGCTKHDASGKVDMGSPQVGHFLTAVDIGRRPPAVESLLRIPALGHELIGDDQSEVKQIKKALANPSRLSQFKTSILAAETEDRVKAHRAVKSALPELSAQAAESGRVGNSLQDLLNTSYGIAFGRKVRNGVFHNRTQAADWLLQNVGVEAKSLPWL